MDFYQGFTLQRIRPIPDNALFSSRTVAWRGFGLRGIILKARTLKELKEKIAAYHAGRRSDN